MKRIFAIFFQLAIIINPMAVPSASAENAGMAEIKGYFANQYPLYVGGHYSLFLHEYFAARFYDFKYIGEHTFGLANNNIKHIIGNNERFNTLNLSIERPVDLPNYYLHLKTLSANSEVRLQRLLTYQQKLKEVQAALLTTCSDSSNQWMVDTFMPTKMYRIPVYHFNSNMIGSINSEYYFEVKATFDENGFKYDPNAINNGRGSARESIVYGACVAAGTIIGAIAGAGVGAAIGFPIGAALGHIANQCWNTFDHDSAYQEYVKNLQADYSFINQTIYRAHANLDELNKSLIANHCKSNLHIGANANGQIEVLSAEQSAINDMLKKQLTAVSEMIKTANEIVQVLNSKLAHLERQYHQAFKQDINFLALLNQDFDQLVMKNHDAILGHTVDIDVAAQSHFTKNIFPLISSQEEKKTDLDEVLALDQAWGETLLGDSYFNQDKIISSHLWDSFAEIFYSKLQESKI